MLKLTALSIIRKNMWFSVKSRSIKILAITGLAVLAVVVLMVLGSRSGDSSIKTDDSHDQTVSKSSVNRHSQLSDVAFDDNKVNIYFFWGQGCSYCEKEFQFLESIDGEYREYFNIYAFEVWHDQSNRVLLDDFAEIMDETVSGVPFTIIGDETFSGFASTMESEFKNAIITQATKDFDVYREYQKDS